MITVVPDAVKPGFQCVRTHWNQGFIAFRRDRHVQRAPPGVLAGLGAVQHRAGEHRFPHDPDFIVLADTEGNRFCIVNLGHEHRPPGPEG
jgi:hypothetical protein